MDSPINGNLRRKADALLIGVMFAAMLGSSVVASASQAAAASSSAQVWAAPSVSRVDDGHFQMLKGMFTIVPFSPISMIKVTVDGSKVLEFKANGDIISADPAFKDVKIKTKLHCTDNGEDDDENDDDHGKADNHGKGCYSLDTMKGKITIAMDKQKLGVGTHSVVLQVITGAGTLSDHASFVLKAGSGHNDDDKHDKTDNKGKDEKNDKKHD